MIGPSASTEPPLHVCTPLLESTPLSDKAGRQVLLKMEAWQPIGSFKIRGIGRLAQVHRARGAQRLVSSSGGNAGMAVAYAARRLGMAATIYVPETTPETTVHALRQQGATVHVAGAAWDDAHAIAMDQTGTDAGSAYVHPFDDPLLWAGHATMVHELSQQLPTAPGAIVVAVGGGGLLCGVLQGLDEIGWSHVPVVAVETVGADCLRQSLASGSRARLERIDSIATTLGARSPCQQAIDQAQKHHVQAVTVTDRDAVLACTTFLDDHRCLVEPACGAALSVAYTRPDLLPAASSVLLVVCGGAGANLELLRQWQSKTAVSKR